ncbi:DUF2530 domain-containing protein [Oerskovia flava]|uniref:DUF2530 domain-containing protein n=1 Tax=Oerskovia flava TaxID=2986422 RepID=UPI00223F6149|nr:DUF2530 domain-containing protein [Oerskovia sp. JB1-3-2]
MPSLISLLVHPERRRPGPPPLVVDLRTVLLAGIALWALALVVGLVLLAVGANTPRLVATSAAGIALGGIGLLWERRHRSQYRSMG